MAVEVVGREVQQHRGLGRERHRVLELERGGLADDRRVGGRARADAASSTARRRRCRRPRPAGPPARWIAPISSTVVVLPLVPVTAMNWFGEHPPGQLELADHRQPALACGGDHAAPRGHAGALDDAARALRAARRPSPPDVHLDAGLDAAATRRPARRAAHRAPITSSPRARSASAAATPERARPTTR